MTADGAAAAFAVTGSANSPRKPPLTSHANANASTAIVSNQYSAGHPLGTLISSDSATVAMDAKMSPPHAL